MSRYLETRIDIPVGVFLDDTDFIADILEFYYDQPEAEPTYTVTQIRNHIFSDSDLYKRFCKYHLCGESPRVDSQREATIKRVLRILTLEKIAETITHLDREELYQICDYTNSDIYKGGLSSNIPGTNINLWNGLRQSLYRNLTLNNLGQVIYHIEDADFGYRVFSHELGIHYVDGNGRVVSRETYYREQEQEIMDKLFTILMYIEQHDGNSENRGSEYQKFFDDYCEKYKNPEDTDTLINLRFKMYLYELKRDAENALKDIRKKGFGFEDLQLIQN